MLSFGGLLFLSTCSAFQDAKPDWKLRYAWCDGDLHAVGPAMEDGHTSATMEGDGGLHAVGPAMEDGHTSATMEGDGDLHAVGPAMEDGHNSATVEGDGDLQTVGPAMEDGHTPAVTEGTSFCKLEMRNFIFTLIKECEFIGIRIDAIITDMGPGNQAIWSICYIGATKHGKTSVSCAHPCANGSDRQLFFIADAPHVLKNLRGHLVRGQLISIPDEIVERNKLPTSEVSLSYVRDVAQRDGTSALNLAPHLKDKHLDPNHYEKMSVSSALAVLNHSTGSAIRVLVKEGKMSPAAVTTAWFLETVYKWFRLMTSRTKSLAMSELNSRKHDDAVEFLSEVLDLFKKMTIHLPGKSPSWKPVQTGVVISTTAALSLQNLYLTQNNFKYLFLSRLTQDTLENLFSVIRRKNATPRPLQFKTALRTITLSQFFQPCRTGNYEMDDAEYLADFISKRQTESPSEEVLQQDGAAAIQDESAWELPDDDDQMLAQVVDVLSDSQAAMGELQSTDKQSLHYLCGYTRLAHLWNLVFLLHRRLQRWVPLWSRILQLLQLFPLLALVHLWIQARQQILATLMSPGLLLLPLALVHPWTQGSLQTLAALPCPGPFLSLAPLRGLLENFQLLPRLESRQGHETTSTRP
ncbi:uncharacterized protein ISCGN_004305 [Ixodes scapularis]